MAVDKFYIIFAGVNGAGKSTFYRSNMWKRSIFPDNLNRVNSDEILREQEGNSDSENDQIKAMRVAVTLINEFFEAGISFNQETTLAGRESLQDIRRAKSLGYKVIMFYVGVNSPEIAYERVLHRASIGGHDIPRDFIQKRYDNPREVSEGRHLDSKEITKARDLRRKPTKFFDLIGFHVWRLSRQPPDRSSK